MKRRWDPFHRTTAICEERNTEKDASSTFATTLGCTGRTDLDEKSLSSLEPYLGCSPFPPLPRPQRASCPHPSEIQRRLTCWLSMFDKQKQLCGSSLIKAMVEAEVSPPRRCLRTHSKSAATQSRAGLRTIGWRVGWWYGMVPYHTYHGISSLPGMVGAHLETFPCLRSKQYCYHLENIIVPHSGWTRI